MLTDQLVFPVPYLKHVWRTQKTGQKTGLLRGYLPLDLKTTM
jgi:hypothetical protein